MIFEMISPRNRSGVTNKERLGLSDRSGVTGKESLDDCSSVMGKGREAANRVGEVRGTRESWDRARDRLAVVGRVDC